MTLLQLLSSAAGVPASLIREALAIAANAAPDLADALNGLIAKLDEAITPETLASLAAALPAELKSILAGHLDPRNHPSDAA